MQTLTSRSGNARSAICFHGASLRWKLDCLRLVLVASARGAAVCDAARKMEPPSEAQLLESAVERLMTSVRSGPVGVDVVHIPTWARYLELTGEPLLQSTYRQEEISFAAGRTDRLSTRLAGKEAVLKVLGTGVRSIGFRDIEIVSEPDGRPTVRLHEAAAARASELAIDSIEISLCHEGEYAIAVAAGQRIRS